MSNTLQWVYNHLDPDLVTTVFLAISIVVFLHAVIMHSKVNDKRFNMVLGVVILCTAAYSTSNTLWHNMYATYEPRTGFNKIVTIGSDVYMVEDTDLSRIVLERVNIYDPSFIDKYKATYGSVGSADTLILDVVPKPKEESLDCSTPSGITSK